MKRYVLLAVNSPIISKIEIFYVGPITTEILGNAHLSKLILRKFGMVMTSKARQQNPRIIFKIATTQNRVKLVEQVKVVYKKFHQNPCRGLDLFGESGYNQKNVSI